MLSASLLLLATIGLAAGCSSDNRDRGAAVQGTGVGIDLDAMDKSVAPGKDFYLYANGAWEKAAVIPADRSSVGVFPDLRDRADAQMAELVTGLAGQETDPGTAQDAVRRYHAAFMDVAAIEKAGLAPVQGQIARYDRIATNEDLSRALGQQLRADVDPFNWSDVETPHLFGLFVSAPLSGGENEPYLLPGGLSLPTREAYGGAQRAVLQRKVTTMLRLAGRDDAAGRAARVVALEAKIAAASPDQAALYDFISAPSSWQRDQFARKAPGMDWSAFFEAAGLGGADTVIAYRGENISRLAALVGSEPIEVWRDWLVYRHLADHADVLPAAFAKAALEFDAAISGVKKARPRNEQAIKALDRHLGGAMSRLYAERYMPDSDRRAIREMTRAIKDAFAARLAKADWLDPETRDEALRKLSALQVGIGYPENFESFRGLDLRGKGAYAATIAADDLAYRRQMAKLGKPQDRGEWWIRANDANALNLPLQNAINLPAAILQPPMYNAASDPAANYGAIGAVIGHEISHAFDSLGASFDSSGVLRNWWTREDLAEFNRRAAVLSAQYSAYRPFPGVAIDGEGSLAENIADVAGLAAAYDAYRASLDGREPPVIEGLTGEQRFFIAFAQSNRSKRREKAERTLLLTDSHAPDHYRALTVRNIDAWYRAFDVQPGAELYLAPRDRITIW
ncbi:putative endopeptidase [Croceicoccus sp. BE223]|nr:putative endopeptidase [Croceicoccus sp. BE223]